MTDRAVIAVDVGGTSIKAAAISATGATIAARNQLTPVAAGPAAIVAAIQAAVAELHTVAPVAAVGLVVPGVVDPVRGVARYSANLGWRDLALGAAIQDGVSVPVQIEHDVRAAGLAERMLGAARGAADALVVVIGTGIAGVVIAGGQAVPGALELAGEIGHVPVYPDGEACACGQRGCTETYASAGAIARRYAARTGMTRSAADIGATRTDDAVAGQVWSEAAGALGLALAAYTLLLDPALIVLAGGLSAAGAALRDPVRAALAERLAWRAAPAVELSPLAERAGQYGAALLAWRAAGHDVGASWSVP